MWIDDQVLARCAEPVALSIWIPDQSIVVLGNANDQALEAHADACTRDNVPILKRYGGGGAVVLYPGCVVLSVGAWVKSQFDNSRYFRLINQAVADTLSMLLPADIEIIQRGISDLCVAEKKFAGTSLFRSKNYLLYQASVICDLRIDDIAKYLKHPSKEPDYRAKRSHKDFLMGLSDASASLTAEAVKYQLELAFKGHFLGLLQEDLLAPQPSQFANLEARRQRSNK